MDVTENNKKNIGSYLEFMISCSPQKNSKAISNSEKNLLKCLKKRARKYFFLLTRTTFLERFTEIPKNLLANQDANVWINMLFHLGQIIRDKSVAKISSDESCQYSYASFKAKYFVFMDSYWKIQKTKLITRW